MSLGNTMETELLEHLFENSDIANIGDATGLRGSTTAGSLYIALHTGDPGEGGDQTTNEAAYGAYARVAVVRSAAGWTTTGNTVVNAADVTFPEATSGSETETHFSIGTSASGAGKIILSGALTASRAVSTGIQPYFPAGDLSATAD